MGHGTCKRNESRQGFQWAASGRRRPEQDGASLDAEHSAAQGSMRLHNPLEIGDRYAVPTWHLADF